jgi:integrase
MALSDATIRSAKAREKPFKLYDGDGLYVLVAPNGSKLWRMKYRLRVADPGAPETDQNGEETPRHRGRPAKSGNVKEGLLSFGAYPALGLKAARASRDQALELLAAGKDPAREKRRQEAREQASAAASFDAVATEFVAKREREGLAASTLTTYRLFQSKLRPGIGRYPIAEITPADLLDALRKIERTGALETASRTREFAGRVFRYAIATARAERDVASDLRGALTAPTVKGLPAVTDPMRVGEILRAIDGYRGQPSTMLAMKLAPLVFQRPGEVTGMHWDELDLDAAVWRVPAGRKKERRDHMVPLPTQAVAILRRAAAISPGGPFVFPGLISTKRPITTTTLAHGLRRIGVPNDEHVTHGWRKTASTLLNESGKWSADAIERALAHQDASVRGIYNIGAYWDERVRMAQWWADYLDILRSGAEIVPFRKGA